MCRLLFTNIFYNIISLYEIALKQYKKLKSIFNNTVFKGINIISPLFFLSFGGGEEQSYWVFSNIIQVPPECKKLTIFSVNKDSFFDYWFEYNISKLNDLINGNSMKPCPEGEICLFNYEDRRLIAA